ncbi:MAG: S1 RNA-binding domain-containing protein [Gammaproteobacteria bacterium]|nr:S1 RNA-binding domain-containing protein [Gammaproteobacteria bacterium]
MEVDDLITVRVKRVEPGYVLVDYLGLEATLQQTELTWKAGAVDPADYVKEGEEIVVRVVAKEGDRYSPSLKQVEENPWNYPPRLGEAYQSPVVMVTAYGYFINIEYYCNALLLLENAKRKHSLHEIVKVVVIEVDEKQQRVSLSEI